MEKKKIKRMKDNFYKEIISIFEYNRNTLKIDTFYSCHKIDKELEVPIFNIRDVIKEKETRYYFKYHNLVFKNSMKYSNYLKNIRELGTETDFEDELRVIFNEIRWMLLISAKYDEKFIDGDFYIILNRN